MYSILLYLSLLLLQDVLPCVEIKRQRRIGFTEASVLKRTLSASFQSAGYALQYSCAV